MYEFRIFRHRALWQRCDYAAPGFAVDLLDDGWQDFEVGGFAQCLSGRTALEPIALVAALDVVEAQEDVESLNLGGLDVPVLAPLDAEALVEQRAVHALDENR